MLIVTNISVFYTIKFHSAILSAISLTSTSETHMALKLVLLMLRN